MFTTEQLQNEKTSIVVRKTTNYTTFQNLNGNRFIREAHVRRLMKSFERYPNMAPARPVLINDKQEIIDGQHRVEACKRLKMPIYYMIIPGLGISDARTLNALQSVWGLLDYAESFAMSGVEEYKEFLELYNEYKLPPATLLQYTCDSSDIRSLGETFRSGEYTARDIDDIQEDLNHLRKYSDRVGSIWATQSFAKAIFTLMKNPAYSQDKMLKALKDVRVTPQGDR